MRLIRLTSLCICLACTAAEGAIALNPDVTQDTIQLTICKPGYTKSIRPSTTYTNGIKLRLMREQGVDASRASEFELDHIVALSIGGHPRSLDNLALQPWEGEDGAKRKDRLEVKLQCLVCDEQVPLAVAQRDMYDDWQAAYHHYAKMKCSRHRSNRFDPGD